MSIPESGEYEVYIYTESGTVLTGEFEVEQGYANGITIAKGFSHEGY